MIQGENSERFPDRDHIDIKESWDLNYWCEELNLRAEDLMEIVREVGPSAHEVRLYLTKNLLINWPASY